jgi:hypothetical protein
MKFVIIGQGEMGSANMRKCTPRGEGALFTVKKRRIQSYAEPSDGVIYDEDTGKKIDGYVSVEEKSVSQPDTHTISGVEEKRKIKEKWNQAPHQGIVESLLKRRDERMASVINNDSKQLSESMFAIDEVIYYYDKGIWFIGRISRVIPRTSQNWRTFHQYEIVPEGASPERCLASESDVRHLEWGLWNYGGLSEKQESSILPILTNPLHSLNCVGIDTCSALSVSTELRDFSHINASEDAKSSVSLRGIGGDKSIVKGRGPMVISVRDDKGTLMYMIDPAGVYLDKASSSQLRILGQQRIKRFGFDLVQNKLGDGRDFLVHRSRGTNYTKETNIPLITQNGILMLETCKVNFNKMQKDAIRTHVQGMTNEEKDGNLFYFEIINNKQSKISPVLVMNEGELTDKELLRLNHWRHAHRMISGV